MILLKKIRLINFLSHADTEIVFSKTEQLLIDGASGSGKSSILDGLIWTLYGNSRVDNRSLVRRGTKKASVCLELSRDEETVIIARSVTSTGKHTLEVTIDGIAHPLTGVRELQNWIDKDLIGASYLLFINSVAYVQGNTESFVAQTAPKRKELLLEIVHAEDYSKYYEKARQRLSELSGEEKGAEGQLAELEAQLGAIHARLGSREALTKDITDCTAKLTEILPKKVALEEKKAAYMSASRTIGILQSVYKATLTDAEKFEVALGVAVDKVKGRQRLINMLSARPGHIKDIEQTTETLTFLRKLFTEMSEQEIERSKLLAVKPIVTPDSAITYLEKQLESNSSHNTCPSGDACPHQKGAQKNAENTKAEIERMRKQQKEEAVALAEWSIKEAKLPVNDIRATMGEINRVETHLGNLKTEESRFDRVQFDLDILTALETDIPRLTGEMRQKWEAAHKAKGQAMDAELAIDQEEVNRVANSLLGIDWEEKGAHEKITRATAALENLDKDEAEFASIEAKIASVRGKDLVDIREKTRKVEIVKDAFSERGIKTLVVDYLLPKLEDRINAVLSQLSDIRIQLSTQKKSADMESNIEGLWITVVNERGEEMAFENYSGGEKVRLVFAIAEGFASLSKKRIGFKIIDEAILALDVNSLENFLVAITEILKDTRQVLFISHIQDIKDLFTEQIKVVKHNGISTVEK